MGDSSLQFSGVNKMYHMMNIKYSDEIYWLAFCEVFGQTMVWGMGQFLGGNKPMIFGASQVFQHR